MEKTDGLVQAIMQGGMGNGDAIWIAGFVRTYFKKKIKNCPYTYRLEKGYCPKDIKQALGLTE